MALVKDKEATKRRIKMVKEMRLDISSQAGNFNDVHEIVAFLMGKIVQLEMKVEKLNERMDMD